MSNFIPFPGKIVIEPINNEKILLSDGQKYEEMGRVVEVPNHDAKFSDYFPEVGDIVFFLAYGVEQTPEYEGKTYYVVPWDSRFIIGHIPCTTKEVNVSMDFSTTIESPELSRMALKKSADDVKTDNSSTNEPQTASTSPTTSESV